MRRGRQRLAQYRSGVSMISRVLAALLLIFIVAGAAAAQGVMYAGVWPADVLVMDEASGAIKDKIQLRHGAAFSLTRSQDRKRFYAVTGLMQTIEVIDLDAKKVVDEVTFSAGNK